MGAYRKIRKPPRNDSQRRLAGKGDSNTIEHQEELDLTIVDKQRRSMMARKARMVKNG